MTTTRHDLGGGHELVIHADEAGETFVFHALGRRSTVLDSTESAKLREVIAASATREEAVAKLEGSPELHVGDDYAELHLGTGSSALIKYPDALDIAALRTMAAAPALLALAKSIAPQEPSTFDGNPQLAALFNGWIAAARAAIKLAKA